MGFLSPDNRCLSFDAQGNGYARGEGVVSLVVRPLNDALRNGDVIRAIIRMTGSNQDGRTPGITQPSAEMQEALIRHVYAKAGLDLADTRYFEAHGELTLPDLIDSDASRDGPNGMQFRYRYSHRRPNRVDSDFESFQNASLC